MFNVTTLSILFFTMILGEHNLFSQGIIYSTEDQKIMERMELAEIADVKEYMKDILDAEVPSGRILDEYFTKPTSYVEASERLGRAYPQFYQKTGGDLINAVKLNPLDYREMIFDYKLLRDYYDEY